MTAASDRDTGRAQLTDERVADHDAVPRLEPSRPVAIELAAAVLLAAGVFRLIAIRAVVTTAGPRTFDPGVATAEAVLQALTIVTAVLIRTGRAWLAAVNIAAVLTFLEVLNLTSPVSAAFSIMFGLAFVATFVNKPWFDAKTAWRAAQPERRR
jgi:hypothetical protein